MATSGGAVHTPPSGPQPSQIQSAPNLVAFDPKLAVPSQPIYVQRNDLLAFNILTNGTQVILRLDYRWLTPEGEIKEGEFNTPQFSGSFFFSFPLYEGWLLSFTARCTNGPFLGQWTFLQAFITRSVVASAQSPMHSLIWQGFIPQFNPNGWPGMPARAIDDGQGMIRSITGALPAAGAEVSEIVPAQRRWTLTCLTVALTTSATVANRTPFFFIDDGVNFIYVSIGITTQAAGQTVRYSFCPVIPSQAFVSGSAPVSFPFPFPLKVGFRIKSSTAGLQAGDQWSAPQYSVLEWGQWDS